MKVTILDMQPIEPATGGGRLRLLGLYHALGEGIQSEPRSNPKFGRGLLLTEL